MRGFLLAVAVLATIAITSAVDEECIQRKVRGLPVHWPNPTDCSSFYRCTNKNIKRELLCPTGKEYNPRTGRCGSKGNGLCQLSLIAPLAAATNPCADEISGAFVADPKSCRGFYICNNNLAYPQTCDPGSYFITEVLDCEPDTQTLCWENLCVKKSDGVLHTNANDCHSFYICNDEKPVKQICPEGSYFNSESLNCQPGKCPSEETTTTPATTEETSTIPTSTEETTTTCVPDTTTACVSETTTTCVPETTTCVPEPTTTTCAAVTITTTCAAETTTTTCAAEITTLSQTTTTCAPNETTTPSSTDEDCSNIKCDSRKCENITDVLIFPARNTSAGFCICLNQKAEYRPCLDDAIFNESLLICVAQDKACASSNCLEKPDFTTFPADNTTAGFCRCLQGKASYFPCVETDYVYSEELGFCVKSSSSDEETSTLCEGGYKEGEFVPSSNNSMFFYICFEGELLESSCETGNYYDDKIKACLPDTEGKCLDCQVTESNTSRRRNRRSLRAATCVEGVKSAAVDCDKYYKCSGGQKLLYGCGKDNLFNVTTLSCQFDTQHICWHINTCINGVKTPHVSESEKYYECVDGKQILRSCAADSYFSKLSLTCVANEVCTCPGGYKDGDISAHPTDCDKFYICIGGQQKIHECGKGNFFNETTLCCETDVKNICKAEQPCMCPGGYKEGDVSAHPQDCDKFYICSKGKQILQECGKDNRFNKNTLICEPDIYNECWSKVPCTCPGGYEEGTFSAHPTECDKCYICHGGQQVLQDCGLNNHFNNDTLTCEPDVYHKCWPNLCGAQPDGTLVANPQQCNSFFMCKNQEARPQSCPEGQYFDAKDLACEADVEAICYNPCENESGGPIVLLPHPVCNMYYFCNGRKTYVGTCQVGSFDIVTGVCNEAKKCSPNPCANAEDGTLFPDPYDPTKFLSCKDGKAVTQSCDPAQEFNPIILICLKASDPDCPVCEKDGYYPTLDEDNDSEFCVCNDDIATKIECPQEYTYNAELRTCYSNAPCDPSYCLENDASYVPYQNRNDSKSFCMCVDKKPVIVACPNNGTFNPYTSRCSDYEISPECKQSECIGDTEAKVFLPLTPKTSNGICVCQQQIATFRPCNYGSTLNPSLVICQLAEINCNSYQCRNLADNAKIPALTTNQGYCECISGVANYRTCPGNGEFNGVTKKCETPVCDLTKCGTNYQIPASNTLDGYCICPNGGYVDCDPGTKFSVAFSSCIQPCSKLLCQDKAPGTQIESSINKNSYCVCHGNAINNQPTFAECPIDKPVFDKIQGKCTENAKELCAGIVCTGLEYFEAANTVTGFCLCTAAGSEPTFQRCPEGIYDAQLKTCILTAADDCDVSKCANATIDHPLTVPSKSSNIAFCYCSSPTDAMLLPCPAGKFYDDSKGLCVNELEGGVLCPDDIEDDQKVKIGCNKYSICVAGIMEPKTCPAGQYFNENKQACLLDTEGICDQQSESTCLGAYYENEHLPHPINKHLYYVCKSGSLHEYTCPGHLIYSDTQKQCVVGAALFTRQRSPQKRSVDFNTDHEFGCLEKEKRSVPSNCSQYEICLENTWKRKTCSNYRYYNPEQKKCLEPRDDFVCSYAKVTTLPTCNASMTQHLHQAKTCQQYYRCLEGKWQLQKCGRQQYFNAKMATCLPVPQSPEFQCLKVNNKTLQEIIKQNTTCQHLSQRFYRKNCAMYLICLDKDWWYQYCPLDMFYNRTLNYCVPDVQQQCPDVIKTDNTPNAEEFSQDLCQQDGLLRPSALACNRYFVCLNGKWQMQHCAPKEFYDIAHAKCSPDSKAVCSQLYVDCLPNEKRAVPRNCSAYEQCSSEGKWLKLSCPQGEIYDELLQQCNTNQGICSEHGLKRACRNEEIMPVKTNCSMFYYCSLDSWSLGNCLKGFMYLPEKQMCVVHATEDNCKALIENKLLTNILQLQNESELCVGKPDGASVAHSSDCSRYYICIQQTSSHEMQCSKGSYFEASLGYCRPNDGTCRLPLTGVCANASDESLIAHPTDCQAFYKCSTINGSELLNCPEGQYYHNSTQQCRIDHGECKKDLVSVNKCSGFAHGTRLAHETYCNIYYACVKGLAIPVECPDNYQFNGILGKCLADVQHQCQNGQLIPGNITYSCGNLTYGSYLPDRKDCTRYYICSQGQALPKKCANSSYFDSELLMCVPDDGSCPFVNENDGSHNPVPPDPSMCEGKHGYLMADPFNCNNFYACIHNKLKHERCYSQQFFNTTTQQCQQKPLKENNGNTTAIDLMQGTPKNLNSQCLDETTSIHKLCTEMSVGTSLAEPGDCRRYITCQEVEEEPISQRCRNGESFDSLLGFCRQNDGTCLLENGQRVGECSGKHGQLARDLNNCRNYFVCINGQKIAQTCQADEYFSKSQNMCRKDTQNVCTIQTPEEQMKQSCAGLSESVLYPYIYDNCRSYFQCIKGAAKIHKCADDLYFDPLAIKCVKNKTECIMPTATLQRSPAFSQTFSQLCSNKKLEYPYANLDNECRSFYICHGNGDVSHELCPLGMKFNKELNICSAENKTQCI